MPALVAIPPLFPSYSPHALLAFQFSNWYPDFARFSIKSTVLRPLSPAFRQYLDSDGVFVPEGAEDVLVLHDFISTRIQHISGTSQTTGDNFVR